MTHDDILKAARERIAEIDKQTAAMAEERGKLQAMLSPTRFVAPLPVAPPLPAGPGLPWYEPPWWPMPEVTWYPRTDPIGTFITTTGTSLVIGGEQRPGSGLVFRS